MIKEKVKKTKSGGKELKAALFSAIEKVISQKNPDAAEKISKQVKKASEDLAKKFLKSVKKSEKKETKKALKLDKLSTNGSATSKNKSVNNKTVKVDKNKTAQLAKKKIVPNGVKH